MENLREYLLTITAAALICSILTSLLQNKKYITLLKLLCGIFMTLCLLRPWLHVTLEDIRLEELFVSAQAEAIVTEGRETARDAMVEAVKEQTAAYIRQRAAVYDAIVSVQVTVEEYPPIPVQVEISGAVSPLTRQRLSTWIAEELGIGEEAQKWVS